jgi:hypothetical protein
MSPDKKKHIISNISLSRCIFGRRIEELSDKIEDSLEMRAGDFQWLL